MNIIKGFFVGMSFLKNAQKDGYAQNKMCDELRKDGIDILHTDTHDGIFPIAYMRGKVLVLPRPTGWGYDPKIKRNIFGLRV